MYFTVAELRLLTLQAQLRRAQHDLDVVRRYRSEGNIKVGEALVKVYLDKVWAAKTHVESERRGKDAAKDQIMGMLTV